jgi:hypothetical protein
VDGWPAPLLLKKENIMADTEQAQQLLEQEGQRLYADGAAITENGRQRHGAATFDAAIQDVTAKLGNAGRRSAGQSHGLVKSLVKKPPTSPLTSSFSPATIALRHLHLGLPVEFVAFGELALVQASKRSPHAGHQICSGRVAEDLFVCANGLLIETTAANCYQRAQYNPTIL